MESVDFDCTPRYAPDTVVIFSNGRACRAQVIGSVFYPAGTAPKGCPIRVDWNALELKTLYGSRWYGCESAKINSELRMVVVGFPASFEEMAAWKVCTQL